MYYMTRNRLLFARRNFKKWDRVAAMLFFTFISVPKNLATLILKGQFELIKPFFKGIIWNFSH
jgi:hypothetical protein